jgi:hypothetical protein
VIPAGMEQFGSHYSVEHYVIQADSAGDSPLTPR